MQRSALASPLRYPRRVLFGILVGLGVCTIALAATAPTTRRAKVTTRHHVAATKPVAARHATTTRPRQNGTVGQAGMRVFRDTDTGLIGPPTPQQAADLAASEGDDLMFSSEGLHPMRMPDGSLMIDLQGRYQESAVARKNAAGKVEWNCVSGEKAVKKYKNGAGAAPARGWEVQ